MQILQDKKFNAKTDRIKALNYIINAKGYAEKMKNLGISIDEEWNMIITIEKQIYNLTQ